MSDQSTIEEGKTMAIISYITIIGLIIAFIVNNGKKNSFTSFHIRQSLGIAILGIVISILSSILSSISAILGSIISLLGLVLFVFAIIGVINAAKGEAKVLPVLGEKFQEWFKSI